MPIDASFLPALEEELWMAKRVKGGGQKPDPARIAAIEEQIKLHEAAAKREDAKPENASDVSTDYQSHDADAGVDSDADKVTEAREREAKRTERAVSKDKNKETADA